MPAPTEKISVERKVVRAACPHDCPDTCAMVYEVEDGKLTKMKTTTEMKDKDTMVFKMYNVGKDGKDAKSMTITYKRKK